MCNSVLSSDFEYKASLALNNMAITMIERSCHGQAYDTLKDAAFALAAASRAFGSECTGDDQSHSSSALEVQKRLQAAYIRSAQPDPSPILFFPINVMSHNNRVKSTDFSFKAMSEQVRVHTLIRVDSNDTELLENMDEYFDLSSAIILYNYAIASLAKANAMAQRSKRRSKALKESAIKLLTLSGDLLSRLYEACEESYILSRIIFISAALLQMLSQTLLSAGQVQEAESCISTLEFLGRVAEDEMEEDRDVAALIYAGNIAAAA